MKMHVPAQEGAYELQNKALALLKGKILARIEQVLNEFNIPGKTVRIPQINIDLTEIIMNDVTDDMVVHVEEKLRHYLQRVLRDNLGDEQNEVTIVTHAQSELDLVRFILTYGCLPWWAHTPQNTPLSIQDIFSRIFGAGSNNNTTSSNIAGKGLLPGARLTVQELYAALKPILHLPQVHERLVRYLSAEQLQTFTNHALEQHAGIKPYVAPMLTINVNRQVVHALVLKALHPGHAVTTQTWLGYMIQLLALADTTRAGMFKAGIYHDIVFKNAAFRAALLKAGKNQATIFKTAILKVYLSRIMARDTLVTDVLKSIAETHVLTGAQKTQLLLAFTGQHASIKTPADVSRLLQAAQKGNIKNVLKPGRELPGTNRTLEQNEGIYIDQAGLVLVHAYLVPLFNTLGLLEKNNFRDEHARHYAVHVLHYLAVGHTSPAEEHELVLHKLLCGLEPETPLDLNHVVSEAHQQECENLLQAVIDNWGALKRSSPAALRQSFFARSGCLRKQSNGWTLNIERTGFDVLLDKLPWGINIIKTPWYNEFIFVEW